MTPLEITANAVMTVSIVLAGRNNVHSWWTGIVGCTLFASLFYGVQLYADVALQVFFVLTCVVGWVQWLRGAGGKPRPITSASVKTIAVLAAVGVVATVAYGLMLREFTDAYAPFIDSAVLAFSVIAQFLLMGRRVETWPVWVLVNTISVPLYASRGLYLTAALYAAYWVNAVVSWWWWQRQMKQGG
ncbi:nicotinamide riboside transporter PnuC [Pseudoduganella flava]|uniref:Nicotinamide riboside transporter PnuC n=2 Tax=Pseudoduganella flava TaxID=871742 RepID=A0ABX6FWR3_9BURK|nr:nicotinamide riboside transporter PnuC [Pseudoduganella flava]QGZ40957.1 nicotinamide riboside transporter PnuC [Pseudoduganella flava]